MKKNHPVIRSALFLTTAGLLGKIIGFYTRIFLVSLIGAEGIGIYQMVFPLYVLFLSFSSSGIQTALSRFTAEKLSHQDQKGARHLLTTALILALSLSAAAALLLFFFSGFLAHSVFQEPRCAILLRLLAAVLPFEALHACISGYYLGQKKALFPALAGLFEQLLRFLAILLLSSVFLSKGLAASPVLAVSGLLIAEIIVSISSFTILTFSESCADTKNSRTAFSFRQDLHLIAGMALPISLNRLCLSLFQSAEALFVPLGLQKYYGNTAAALSSYGILTGMVLPLIFFPCAVTGSLSQVLLPSMAEARVQNNSRKIAASIQAALQFCLLMGIAGTSGFLLFGTPAGLLLYRSETAGTYLQILAWICPFLYLNTTLSGMLHGLGKTVSVFRQNMAGLTLRLAFVFFAIPRFGMYAYLLGVLLSQLLVSLLGILLLRRSHPFSFSAVSCILKPLLSCLLSATILYLLQSLFPFLTRYTHWSSFLLSTGIWGCSCLLIYRLLSPSRHLKT